jgi:hypothetical protein
VLGRAALLRIAVRYPLQTPELQRFLHKGFSIFVTTMRPLGRTGRSTEQTARARDSPIKMRKMSQIHMGPSINSIAVLERPG